MTSRYAIYAAPGFGSNDPTGAALRAAAEAWLGRSAAADSVPPPPMVPAGWTRAEVDGITGSARRYGFHATLKAPFRLATGRTADELEDRLTAFAGRRAPVAVPELALGCFDGFFALVAGRAPTQVDALAADAVCEFDGFRDAPSAADMARHRPERLDARERELLHRYGYPYVLDRFVLHFTLTDPVPPERQAGVKTALRNHFAALLGRDLVLDSVALFLEPGPGEPFVLTSSHPFEGKAA
jgi:hypothetical protein